MAPENRKKLWKERRVFFLTPQVVMNDLTREICPATKISCVVLDEVHRAQGNHAYCQVIKQLRQHESHKFRVMGLSATPGTDMSSIQQASIFFR